MIVDQGLFTEKSITIHELDIFLELTDGAIIHFIGDGYHVTPTHSDQHEGWLAMDWVARWMGSEAKKHIARLIVPSQFKSYTNDGTQEWPIEWVKGEGLYNTQTWLDNSTKSFDSMIDTWKYIDRTYNERT